MVDSATDISPAEPAAPQRRRNAAESRERLLRAARDEFAQHGFAGARIDRIVQKARSNPRMIYHYFGSKSGLYVAVLEDALGNLRAQELRLDVEHLDPLEGLVQLFDFMNDHFEFEPVAGQPADQRESAEGALHAEVGDDP